MFTGIIEDVGRVRRAERRHDLLVLEVEAGRVLEGMPVGGSIAVSGCCLTAVELTQDGFITELTPETLSRTRFGAGLGPGALVNLERPLRADGRFDGHIVQGHVDGIGSVVDLVWQGESAELRLSVPPGSERYLVEKGSISVEGVSLTVANLAGGTFGIALIPFTLANTNLSKLKPADPVNLEYDVLAKYVERMLAYR